MTRADFPYRKVPGSRRGLFFGASLWLGEDHILSVKNHRFTEEYRRYYLNDIQALTMCKTPRFAFSIYLVLLLFASTVAAIVFSFNRFRFEGRYEIALALTFGIVVYMAWIAFFRSCVCHIQTAVGRDELPALHRIGPARKAFDTIAARVQEIQGELPAEWTEQMASAEIRELQKREIASPDPVAYVAAPEQATGGQSPAGALFSWLTVLFLFTDAALTMYLSGNRNRIWTYVDGGVYLALIVSSIAAIIQIRGRSDLLPLRATLVGAVIFAGLILYAGQLAPAFMMGFTAARNPKKAITIPADRRGSKAVEQVSTVGDILVGGALAGVLVAKRRRFRSS